MPSELISIRTSTNLPSSNNRILSIDPSFKRTGLFLYNGECQFSRIKGPEKLDPVFPSLVKLSFTISHLIKKIYDNYQPEVVIMEYPPPVGQFVAGMWMLTYSVATVIAADRLFLSPPAVGRVLYRTRNWSKSNSVAVASRFFKGHRRLCGDEGDAFVMALPFLPYSIQQESEIVRTYDYDTIRIENGQIITEKGRGYRPFRIDSEENPI